MYLKRIGFHRTLKIFRRTDSILLSAHPSPPRSGSLPAREGQPGFQGVPLGSSWTPVSLVVEEVPELVDPEGVGDPEGSRPIPVFIQFVSKFHTGPKEPAFEAVAATRARCDCLS